MCESPRKIRKLLYFISLLFVLLIGCSTFNDLSIESQIRELNFKELQEILETNNINNNLLQLSLENCITCKEVMKIETENIKEYNIIIYNYTLNKNDYNYIEQLNYIYSYFPDFKYAPSLISLKDEKYTILSFENSTDINKDISNFIKTNK